MAQAVKSQNLAVEKKTGRRIVGMPLDELYGDVIAALLKIDSLEHLAAASAAWLCFQQSKATFDNLTHRFEHSPNVPS
ncbi:hypothetical protein EV651_1192 [Kribbella sp. VKM Ac-2571]|nr:hypothetical protein EV651_1192 [Kribbella sp. VKM Ac-2571]